MDEPTHTPSEKNVSYRRWQRARSEIAFADQIEPKEHIRVYAVSAILLALFGGFVYAATPLSPKIAAVASVHEVKDATPEVGDAPRARGPSPFADISIEASAAFVYDVKKNAVLFEKNGEAQWPLASITKVMTALVASEHLSKDSVVAVPDRAVATYGESGIASGTQFSFKNLLKLTLVGSVNDGAAALALAADNNASNETGFVQAMNEKADEIGLAQTYFLNSTGLDEGPNVGGAYGSARDVALLYSYVLRTKRDLFEGTDEPVTVVPDINGLTYTYENTNPTVRSIPGLIGSKTGFTDIAGGNLAIAFDLDFDRPIVVVALGSSENGRFRDVETLADAARNAVGR